MASDQATNRLYQMVRDFALQTPAWGDAIRYHTQPDERLDLTLASFRVYGTDREWMVIQAAAGLDSVEAPLFEQLLTLPTVPRLRDMRREAGFSGYEIF